MLRYIHPRLFFTLPRHILALSNHLPSINSIRHNCSPEQLKRRILMKINTALSESENPNQSDENNIACLNNELILSERMVKFPFHYRCILEQQFAICPDRWVSTDEWKELYRIIGGSTKPLFASITMLVCTQLKHIERGRSLFDFVEKYHPDLLTATSTTYATYMALLATDFFVQTERKHSQEYSSYEKKICDVYQGFVKDKKQTIVTPAAALGIIKGLSVTHLWREGYSYLPFVNDDGQLQAIIDLIIAALHNDDLDAAIKLIGNLKNPPPSDSAAATTSNLLTEMVRDMFRNLNQNDPKAPEFIECLFRYLSTLDYFIEQPAVDEMQTFFAKCSLGTFQCGTTLVYPSGVCKQLSGVSLARADLTDEDFEFLRKYLLESAYTSEEVYNTTTPAEFEKFKALLNRNKFTMIVDGLNILYSIDRFATDPVSSVVKTINFLKNLRVNQKEMLFIARKHALSRIPFEIQKDLRFMCEVFLVDNTSRDDWFVLYAALHSKAYILTSDILRKERGIANKSTPAKNAIVNEKLQKWLYRYQYMFVRQANRVFYKQPMAYKLQAQYVQNVWLIPFFTRKPSTLAQRPDNWFFLRRPSSNRQTSLKSSPSPRTPTIIGE